MIIVHAGGEAGFVPGACHIFTSKKTSDYYEEMNGPFFDSWFKNQLLPSISPQSVIVLDNARYHTVKVDPLPNKGWRKREIQAWLQLKDMDWTEDMLTNDLLVFANHFHKKSNIRVIKWLRMLGTMFCDVHYITVTSIP